MTIKQIVKSVETRKRIIAQERDKLRDLISELESLEYASTEAVDHLERAADRLSELL